MKKFQEFCANLKVVAAEIASIIFFLLLLYVGLRYEFVHIIVNAGR